MAATENELWTRLAQIKHDNVDGAFELAKDAIDADLLNEGMAEILYMSMSDAKAVELADRIAEYSPNE